MFINFQFGNFRSFKDLQVFSMQSAPGSNADKNIQKENVFQPLCGPGLLKSKAIFGANSSGKSNFVKAVMAFTKMVKSSVVEQDLALAIWSERFAFASDNDAPAAFEYSFGDKDQLYRYGFQIYKNTVKSEWLYGNTKSSTVTDMEYFKRTELEVRMNVEIFSAKHAFPDFLPCKFQNMVRSDALWLTTGALLGNTLLSTIKDKLLSTLTVMDNNCKDKTQVLKILQEGSPSEQLAFRNFIEGLDLGMHGFDLIDLPYSSENIKNIPAELVNNKSGNVKKLVSSHIVYNDHNQPLRKPQTDDFFQNESNGTLKLLGMTVNLLNALKTGNTLIIDNFGTSLHTLLALKLVDFFHSKVTNPKNAQLIVITHKSYLMSTLRPDQLVVVDKDHYGNSKMTCLNEFKDIHLMDSIEKAYLEGVFGGVSRPVNRDMG